MEFRCCGEKSKEIKDVSKTYVFLRAIADPNRLKILCVLQGGPKCVCEIVPMVGISDKLASHHLKQLKKAGILTEKREGNFIRYGLDRKAIREHKSIFNKIIK
ncbi:MAG TPA: transcriptional regulator [Candidatus Moranbacteria bacterium]|nr:transcriptional regulator [Candidatus Moranbacteria bacterium]